MRWSDQEMSLRAADTSAFTNSLFVAMVRRLTDEVADEIMVNIVPTTHPIVEIADGKITRPIQWPFAVAA